MNENAVLPVSFLYWCRCFESDLRLRVAQEDNTLP